MMKTYRPFPALIAALAISIMFLNVVMIRENDVNTETLEIHAVIDNRSDNRWVQFIAGMRQAAEEQNVKLTIVATDHLSSLEEERALVDRAVRDGADGVILQLCGSEAVNETLQSLSGQTNVELVNSGNEEIIENITGIVSPDHKAIGEALAAEAMYFAPAEPEKCTIGVIIAEPSLNSTKQVLEGLQAAMADKGMEITWMLEQEDGTSNLREMLEEKQVPDILIAVDNASLEAAGEYASTQDNPITVVGTGTSTKAIYYLDSGAVRSMVVPEDYMMGYQSLSDLADFTKRNTFTARIRTVDYRVIHQDTMFEEKNQGILFPIQR